MNPVVMKTLFTFEASDDPQLVDDQWVLKSNPDITIQVCGYAGGYAVNQFNKAEGWMEDYGIFKSLKSAVDKALSVA
jgi:hypothetical protein